MAVVGTGIDAVSIERMRRAAADTPQGRRFRARVFTDAERSLCESRRDLAACFAARFAAKEAVMKALGAQGIALAHREIEVLRGADGRPAIALHGRVAARADALGVGSVHVSLTHDAPLAIASVVLESIAP